MLIVYYAIGIVSAILAAVALFLVAGKRTVTSSAWTFGGLATLSSYTLIAQTLKFHSLQFYADFSHWTGLLYNIVNARGPINPSHEYLAGGTLNYMSVHFVPLIYVFATIFKIFPFSETVLIMNFLLMVSATIPLHKLSAASFQDKRLPFFVTILLLWYPTFQYILLYEFEMLRFSIPLLLWMLYFWVTRRRNLFFLFALLAILVREEVGLTVAMFGLYAATFERRRMEGLLTSLLGLVGFLLITHVLMPSMRTTGDYEHIAASSFSAFGTSAGEVALNVFRHPLNTFSAVLQPTKLANIFMLFLPLAFVPVLAPFVLVSMVANLGVGLLSNSITHTSYMLYYVSPSVPFIFYAFIKGWPRLLLVLEAINRNLGRGAIHDKNGTAMACVLGVTLVVNVFFGPSPISLQFWFRDLKPAPFRTHNYHHSAYRITDHHRRVESFCSLIPDSAVVSAEQFLLPRLFSKRGMMVFPQLESVDGETLADYVFIDKTNPMKTGIGAVPGSWNGLRQNPQAYYDLVEKDPGNWQLIRADDGYYLYRRLEADERNAG